MRLRARKLAALPDGCGEAVADSLCFWRGNKKGSPQKQRAFRGKSCRYLTLFSWFRAWLDQSPTLLELAVHFFHEFRI